MQSGKTNTGKVRQNAAPNQNTSYRLIFTARAHTQGRASECLLSPAAFSSCPACPGFAGKRAPRLARSRELPQLQRPLRAATQLPYGHPATESQPAIRIPRACTRRSLVARVARSSGAPPMCPSLRARPPTGARLPRTLRFSLLRDHARLPSLCPEFVETESPRIPRRPRAAAAGKGPASGGASTPSSEWSGLRRGEGCEGHS